MPRLPNPVESPQDRQRRERVVHQEPMNATLSDVVADVGALRQDVRTHHDEDARARAVRELRASAHELAGAARTFAAAAGSWARLTWRTGAVLAGLRQRFTAVVASSSGG